MTLTFGPLPGEQNIENKSSHNYDEQRPLDHLLHVTPHITRTFGPLPSGAPFIYTKTDEYTEETTKNELEELETKYKKLSAKAKIEALIFASPKPIRISEMAILLHEEVEQEEIQRIIEEIRAQYENSDTGFHLVHIKHMGYQFQTVTAAGPLMERQFASKPRPISKAGLETLAIIAYKQPATRAEIEFVRGVDSGGIIKNLMDKGLVTCVGRKQDAGRPMLFGTTDEFLKIFRLSSLRDLPPLESFQPSPEMLKEAHGELEDKKQPVDVENFMGDNSLEERAQENEQNNIDSPAEVKEPNRAGATQANTSDDNDWQETEALADETLETSEMDIPAGNSIPPTDRTVD